MTEDDLCRDRFLLHLPTIVISDHRHRRERNLRLARQFRLRKIGHRDHVEAVPTIQFRFGARGKRRTVHVHVGAAIVYRNAQRSR